MIFVTVGTGEFDELIKKVDELVGEGKIKDKVILKIGEGGYTPKYCIYFRYAETLDPYIREAELIIGHGGVATILESITAGKKFIGVANISPKYPDRHQEEILEKMSSEGYIIWCKALDKLHYCLLKAEEFKPRKYETSKTKIPDEIDASLDHTCAKRILFVSSPGGHTFQMIALAEILKRRYEPNYLVLRHDEISKKRAKSNKIFEISDMSGSGMTKVIGVLRCFVETFVAQLKSRPDAIISCGGGGGITIPAFILGKLMGKKTIFIEDICRIHSKSASGKIIYTFRLANLFFVQWESMKKLYPNAVYVGRLI